ncbi:hypothetical protein DUNSADRAFT_8995 [Dunaliella salina]|uniref:Uncharacterized protein n=1 Tax=Dunaliella salina TaxID=3046 RepID=A0ABQ7GID5_DUNSA|nr:hypothetical protein DUNSADRAFT_8995 [Dunaliella salina]|eukprot:KAF5834372.1 hypothetical protein DUNSADRAFT_8995 [Dunaliella salina]
MIPPLRHGARHTSFLLAAVSQLSRDGAALCSGLHAVDSAARGADSQQQQCSLPRYQSTEAKPSPSIDPRAKAALMMQNEQKQTRGSKAQRTGLKLSPGMENMKATLFSILNDASTTATSAQHRDAVRGLRITLQKGLEQAKADQAKLLRATPQGASPLAVPLILPAEYRADKEMFYACFSALCRFYALPVHYLGPSEYVKRPELSNALEAAEEMEALLVAMEATPHLWIDQLFMDCLMWTLDLGQPKEDHGVRDEDGVIRVACKMFSRVSRTTSRVTPQNPTKTRESG